MGRRLRFMVRMLPVMFVAQAVVVGIVTLVGSAAIGGVDLVPWVRWAAVGLAIGVAWRGGGRGGWCGRWRHG
jgi:hypothetical protein